MMKLFTLLLLWSACISSLPAQSLVFTRTYGGTNYDDARSIVATSDGGFVFTGLNKSDIDPKGSMYLTKVNAAGAVLWTQYYLRPEEDGGNHVLQTSDGGFLITGHTALSYGVNCDGMLVKTNAYGEEQWRVLIGAAYDDVCDAAVELPDGSFLIAGRTESADTRTFRMLLAKVSPSGRVLFQKTIPTATPSVAYAMTQSSDGHLFLAGYSFRSDEPTDKMLVVKCTESGELLWEKTYGSEVNHRANSVVATPDGGCFIAGGATELSSNRFLRMIVCRFSTEGDLMRSSQVLKDEGVGYLFCAADAPEGKLAVAGVLAVRAGQQQQPCFALLDEDLNVLDWQTVSMPFDCRTRAIATNPAGGFIIGGNEYLGHESAAFLAVIRGQSPALKIKDVNDAPMLLFPNPFSDFTYLKVGEPGRPKTLTLSSTDGRVLRRIVFDENEYFLQRGDLPAGVYLCTVRSAEGALLLSGKVLVE